MDHEIWCTSNSIPDAQRLICEYVAANGRALRAKEEGSAEAAMEYAVRTTTDVAAAVGLKASKREIASMASSMLHFELFNDWLTTI